jgi:hypothetical protein
VREGVDVSVGLDRYSGGTGFFIPVQADVLDERVEIVDDAPVGSVKLVHPVPCSQAAFRAGLGPRGQARRHRLIVHLSSVSLLSGGSGRLDTRLDTPPSIKRRPPVARRALLELGTSQACGQTLGRPIRPPLLPR